MSDEPVWQPTRKDRFLRSFAGILVGLLYRDVEVFRPSVELPTGPLLSVSNHFGGFADPLLLLFAVRRRPRFVARDQIWRVPGAGFMMNWIGAIPVHKPEDRTSATSNDEMFASAYQALAEPSHVLIFPEGVTRDDPSIARVKTGAARIALGARANGVEGITIAAAGIHYEDKAALRSRVSVNIGWPLDLDESIDQFVDPGEPADANNREAVRRLTEEIETRLRRVAPDFENWQEANALTRASEITLRSWQENPRERVSISERDRMAGLLGRKPPPAKQRVVEAVDRYGEVLDGLGITDAQLGQNLGNWKLLGLVFLQLLLIVVLLPFALIGLIINIVPFLLVKLVGLLRVAPAVMATIKPMAAIVLFGLCWAGAAWIGFEWLGLEGIAAVLLLMPVYLAAVIWVSERLVLVVRGLRAWTRSGKARSAMDQLMADRQQVLDAVDAAL